MDPASSSPPPTDPPVRRLGALHIRCHGVAVAKSPHAQTEAEESPANPSPQCPFLLYAYSDATWGTDPSDFKSISTYCVFLGSLISWKTKKQTAVARSSAEAELRALACVTAEVTWLRWLLADFGVAIPSTTVHRDSTATGAISIAQDLVKHQLTKHIDIDCFYIRSAVQDHVVSLQYVPSELQLADLLTKAHTRAQHDGSIITLVPEKNSLGQHGSHSQGDERSTHSGPNLPEDIWCHIHSLMSLKAAAQSATLSHAFLRSWRCHPYLSLTEETLGLKQNARRFTMTVDQILKKHSGIGVKTLELCFPDRCKVDSCHLNHWLQIAVTPGIEEFILILPTNYKEKYSFPCSLLFDGRGNSIRHIHLSECAFRPPVGFNCLRSLTKLCLIEVCIADDELGSLISNCFALEKLELMCCSELIFLKIPVSLERLSYLMVSDCEMLQVIESKAPNLFTLKFFGDSVSLLLGESSPKNLDFNRPYLPNSLSYAITKLPSAAPKVETLKVTSCDERVNTPMVADKFLNLKYLKIHLTAFPPAYDYLSLVSFLDASPTLETFILHVNQTGMKHDLVFGDALHVRQIPGFKHSRLRNVQINGFCSVKSMAELTCHILENTTSLESLTVDTIFGLGMDGDCSRRCVQKKGRCRPISRDMILEAHKTLRVVSMYIVGRVPPAVKLNVGKPCSRCHDIDVKLM
ncbi:hypothetical protein U9M48_033320 [Paspalum notatum var. saurae]|uniref:At1g61320/AtMIF1 LRR domain-containing protein n=1 Tax=Paspalum notatum var. saurae TaxID=547442 RepID=A0AAQ3X6G9_PASNO